MKFGLLLEDELPQLLAAAPAYTKTPETRRDQSIKTKSIRTWLGCFFSSVLVLRVDPVKNAVGRVVRQKHVHILRDLPVPVHVVEKKNSLLHRVVV